MRFHSLRLLLVLWVVVGVGLGGWAQPSAARVDATPHVSARLPIDPERVGYPRSMAALGDSITIAVDATSLSIPQGEPANAWATGTNAAVNSHYQRILAAEPAINGNATNFAVNGAKMVDLLPQATQAITMPHEYITLLAGANDICHGNEGAMTTVGQYRTDFTTVLTTLSSGLPDARIFVVSVPDVYQLWQLLHTNPSARFIWNTFNVCQAMLINPESMAQVDVERRARVRQRIVEYNTQLAEVCATFIHCRFDGGAFFDGALSPSDISTIDYFHPSLGGQARLAAAAYAQTFAFTDTVAPVSRAMAVQSGVMRQITLRASDDVGVSGIEYRTTPTTWLRYTAPFLLAANETLIYRAVDVNGNIEGSHADVVLVQQVFIPLVQK